MSRTTIALPSVCRVASSSAVLPVDIALNPAHSAQGIACPRNARKHFSPMSSPGAFWLLSAALRVDHHDIVGGVDHCDLNVNSVHQGTQEFVIVRGSQSDAQGTRQPLGNPPKRPRPYRVKSPSAADAARPFDQFGAIARCLFF